MCWLSFRRKVQCLRIGWIRVRSDIWSALAHGAVGGNGGDLAPCDRQLFRDSVAVFASVQELIYQPSLLVGDFLFHEAFGCIRREAASTSRKHSLMTVVRSAMIPASSAIMNWFQSVRSMRKITDIRSETLLPVGRPTFRSGILRQ